MHSVSHWMSIDALIMGNLVDRQGRWRCFDFLIGLTSSLLAMQGRRWCRVGCCLSCDLLSLHSSPLEEDCVDGIVIAQLGVLSPRAPLSLVSMRFESWYLPVDYKLVCLRHGIDALVPPLKCLDHPRILRVVFKQCNNVLGKPFVIECVVKQAPFLIGTEGKLCLKDISSV
jgi:hypothetical protein